jgi:ATP-dependent RNA helicase DHX33
MAKFPLAPAISRILLSSFALGCPREVTSLLVLLDSADKLLSVPVAAREAANEARQRYVHRSGDHLTLLRLLDGYETTLATGGEAEANRWLKDVSIAKRTMAGVIEARKQLRERCEREGLDWKAGVGLEDGAERILQACMTGLHLSTALLQPDGTYHRTQGRTVRATAVLGVPALSLILAHTDPSVFGDDRQETEADHLYRASPLAAPAQDPYS